VTETVVLGLDGATWDVLDPLVEAEELPNIAGLLDRGRGGSLRSTVPPVTAPAWLSMATGRNPGKTGVFDFARRVDPDSYEFDPVDAGDFQGWSMWDYLADAGASVGAFNIPMLYPPYDIDGYVVSGVGAPGTGPHATPSEVAEELDAVTGGYELKVPYASPEYDGRQEALVRDLERVLEKRATAIEHLLENRPTDHFFGVISATDWAQHALWADHDPDHPLHDERSEHRDALRRIWRRVDDLVGTVAAIADRRDAMLVIVSDHGFGPTKRTFHITEWLEREGYLVRPTGASASRFNAEYFPALRRVGEAVARAVPPLSEPLERLGRRLRSDQQAAIDFERSVAFAPRQNLGMGMLYLTTDDETVRASLVSELAATADELGLDLSLIDPDEQYDGPAADLAPDVMFTLDGLACAVDARKKPRADLLEAGPPSRARSANHRMNGIYLLSGSGVDGTSARRPLSILDIAPTVLYAHDVPIPDDMDGTVAEDAFTPSFTNARTVRRTTPTERDPVSSDRVDRRDVAEQLEDLGYR
jgi:predicted AlkP superfamily phosphohydrolase/phosphomutase